MGFEAWGIRLEGLGLKRRGLDVVLRGLVVGFRCERALDVKF